MIVLGSNAGKPVGVDLEVLMRTRLLIQANSGGGKSWLLRVLAEKVFGKVPVFIIDPEGEFATLREKYDYVLVGKGGETPADTRSAALVARRLLELRASAVCDLFEMRPADRHRWVRLFVEAMIDAPKELWRDVMVVVDEAHIFCPEKGAGESEADDAVISLATRGRKRGFCAVLATQRLGKLRKDAAAEMQNVLIGQTFLDIDQERACDALAVPRAERSAFRSTLKTLEPGAFYALGRAISKERIGFKVAAVVTTHPEAGSSKHGAAAPPPTDKIRHLLPKLADLPKEAEEAAKTEHELRAEIRALKAQVRDAAKAAPPAPKAETKTKTVEVPVLRDAEIKRLEAVAAKLSAIADPIVGKLRAHAARPTVVVTAARPQPAPRPTPSPALPRALPGAWSEPRRNAEPAVTNGGGGPLGFGHRAILTAVAQHTDGVTREQLSVLTGYKRSSRDTYLQVLRSRELIREDRDRIVVTAEGADELGTDFKTLPTGDALREYWLGRLPQGERKILAIVADAYPEEVERERISEATGYRRSSRDTYLQKLAARRLVEPSGAGGVLASALLFD